MTTLEGGRVKNHPRAQSVSSIIVGLALAMLASWGAFAEAPSLSYGGRLFAETALCPWGEGHVRLAAGAGWEHVSLSLFGELPALPFVDLQMGGDLSWTTEWVRVGLKGIWDLTYGTGHLALVARGDLPTFPLSISDPLIDGVIGFDAQTTARGIGSLRIVPSIRAATDRILDTTLVATLGTGITVSSEFQETGLTDSWVELTADFHDFSVASRTDLSGIAFSFARQTGTVSLPALGLGISVILETYEQGQLRLGVGVSWVFGDESVLPIDVRSGGGCVGGTCYGP